MSGTAVALSRRARRCCEEVYTISRTLEVGGFIALRGVQRCRGTRTGGYGDWVVELIRRNCASKDLQ